MHEFDLSSMRAIYTRAATLGTEAAKDLNRLYPSWLIRQGYGLTENCTVVCSTPDFNIWLGSSDSLITDFEARIVPMEGREIER